VVYVTVLAVAVVALVGIGIAAAIVEVIDGCCYC
jgi:hypothetical protein